MEKPTVMSDYLFKVLLSRKPEDEQDVLICLKPSSMLESKLITESNSKTSALKSRKKSLYSRESVFDASLNLLGIFFEAGGISEYGPMPTGGQVYAKIPVEKIFALAKESYISDILVK